MALPHSEFLPSVIWIKIILWTGGCCGYFFGDLSKNYSTSQSVALTYWINIPGNCNSNDQRIFPFVLGILFGIFSIALLSCKYRFKWHCGCRTVKATPWPYQLASDWAAIPNPSSIMLLASFFEVPWTKSSRGSCQDKVNYPILCHVKAFFVIIFQFGSVK